MQDITIRFSTRPESEGEIVGVSYTSQHADWIDDMLEYRVRGGIGEPTIAFLHLQRAPDPEELAFLTDPLFDHISGRERPTIKKMRVWVVKWDRLNDTATEVLARDREFTTAWSGITPAIVNIASGRTLAETLA
jgi:hypothetical protein